MEPFQSGVIPKHFGLISRFHPSKVAAACGKRMADLPMQSAGGNAQSPSDTQAGYGRFHAVQRFGDAGFLLGKSRAFRQGIRHHGQAFGGGIG